MTHIPPLAGLVCGVAAIVLGGRLLMLRALDAVCQPTEAERRILVDRRLDKIRTVWQRGEERRRATRRRRT